MSTHKSAAAVLKIGPYLTVEEIVSVHGSDVSSGKLSICFTSESQEIKRKITLDPWNFSGRYEKSRGTASGKTYYILAEDHLFLLSQAFVSITGIFAGSISFECNPQEKLSSVKETSGKSNSSKHKNNLTKSRSSKAVKKDDTQKADFILIDNPEEKDLELARLWRKVFKIEGEHAIGNYSIELLPSSLMESRAHIIREGIRREAILDLTDFVCFNLKQLVRVLLASPLGIDVQAKWVQGGEQSSCVIRIFRTTELDFATFIQDSQKLAQAMKKIDNSKVIQEPILSDIAQSVVTAFKADAITCDSILEISYLIKTLDEENRKGILLRIAEYIEQKNLELDISFLSILTKLIIEFKNISAEEVAAQPFNEDEDISIDLLDQRYATAGLDREAFLKIALALKNKLVQGKIESLSKNALCLQEAIYKTIVVVLEVMMVGEMHIPQKDHSDLYVIFKERSVCKEARIAYLATFCMQLLNHILTEESSFLKTTHVPGKILIAIGPVIASLCLLEPTSITAALLISLPQSIIEMKKIVKTLEKGIPDWCSDLFLLRLIAEKHPHMLLKLPKEIVQIDNYYLMMGFIDLLTEKLLSIYSCDDGLKALGILGQIYRDNEPNAKHSQKIYAIKEKSQKDIFIHAKKKLCECSSHNNTSISKEVQRIVGSNAFEQQVVKNLKRNSSLKYTSLFDKALLGTKPLHWHLLEEFENDKIFCDELKYYSSSGAGIGLDVSQSVEATTINFLENPEKKVLLITGDPGSGKSFFAKKFARDQLLHYQENTKDYLPVYVPLYRSYRDEVIGDTFWKNIFKTHYQIDFPGLKDKLKKRKVLWIFDAYDELYLDESNPFSPKSVYDQNQLNQWQESKLVITCREGFCDNNQFSPVNQKIFTTYTLKFNEETALRNCINRCEETSGWNLEKYLKVLRKLDADGLKLKLIYPTPFLLSALIIALPEIEKKLKENETIKLPLEELLEDEKKKIIIKERIYSAMACATIIRAIAKSRSNPHYNHHELTGPNILLYCVKMARVMAAYTISKLNLEEVATVAKLDIYKIEKKESSISKEKIFEFVTNKEFQDEYYDQRSADILRTTCLVNEGGFWQFVSNDMLVYFKDLWPSYPEGAQNQEALLKLVNDDPYNFRGKSLFQ
jgi:tRNA uridine 5-carbamoylmethylation protein Kti12